MAWPVVGHRTPGRDTRADEEAKAARHEGGARALAFVGPLAPLGADLVLGRRGMGRPPRRKPGRITAMRGHP